MTPAQGRPATSGEHMRDTWLSATKIMPGICPYPLAILLKRKCSELCDAQHWQELGHVLEHRLSQPHAAMSCCLLPSDQQMHEKTKALLHCLIVGLKSAKHDADSQFKTLLLQLSDAVKAHTYGDIFELLNEMTFLWSAKDPDPPHAASAYRNSQVKVNELCNGILSKNWPVFPVLVRLDAAIAACALRDATDESMTSMLQKLIMSLQKPPTLLPNGSRDDLKTFIANGGHHWSTYRSLSSDSSPKWKTTANIQMTWCAEKLRALSQQVIVRQTTVFWENMSPVLSQLAEAITDGDESTSSDISGKLATIAKSTGCLASEACKTVFQDDHWQVLHHCLEHRARFLECLKMNVSMLLTPTAETTEPHDEDFKSVVHHIGCVLRSVDMCSRMTSQGLDPPKLAEGFDPPETSQSSVQYNQEDVLRLGDISVPYHTLLFAGVEPLPSVPDNVSTIAQELHRRTHWWFEEKIEAYKSLLIKLHTETTETCDQLLRANTRTKDSISHDGQILQAIPWIVDQLPGDDRWTTEDGVESVPFAVACMGPRFVETLYACTPFAGSDQHKHLRDLQPLAAQWKASMTSLKQLTGCCSDGLTKSDHDWAAKALNSVKQCLTKAFAQFANHTHSLYAFHAERFLLAAQADSLKLDEHLQKESLDEEALYTLTRKHEAKHLKECFELWTAAKCSFDEIMSALRSSGYTSTIDTSVLSDLDQQIAEQAAQRLQAATSLAATLMALQATMRPLTGDTTRAQMLEAAKSLLPNYKNAELPSRVRQLLYGDAEEKIEPQTESQAELQSS